MITLCSPSTTSISKSASVQRFYLSDSKNSEHSFIQKLLPSPELIEWKKRNSNAEVLESYFTLYKKELDTIEKKAILFFIRDLSFLDIDIVMIFDCEDKEVCCRRVLWEVFSQMDLECELL